LRAAAALAQLLVEMTPSASATSPQPPRTAQAAWLELMKPALVLATIAPVTATPMEMPNWRALAASAPATPTWSGGSPEIAVLVIAGLTRPAPRPKMA
jgi:hypothetical protein